MNKSYLITEYNWGGGRLAEFYVPISERDLYATWKKVQRQLDGFIAGSVHNRFTFYKDNVVFQILTKDGLSIHNIENIITVFDSWGHRNVSTKG